MSMFLGLALIGSGGGGGGAPAFTVEPDLWLRADEATSSAIPNHQSAAAVPGNIFPFSSGVINGASLLGVVTLTRYAANGPLGALTASRMQFAATALWVFADQVWPAGTYTVRVKLRSNTGAGAQNVIFGHIGGTSQTQAISEAGWTTFEIQLVANGVSTYQLAIREAASGTMDVLVDELQFYAGATAPAFSTEDHDGYGARRSKLAGTVVKSGGAVQSSGAASAGNILLPSYPLRTTLSEATIMCVCLSTDTTQLAAKVLGGEGNEGNFDLGNSSGYAYGRPSYIRTDAVARKDTYMVNKGYVILASRFKAGEQAFFINGLQVANNTATLAAFSRASFGLFGAPFETVGATAEGNFPFSGKVTNIALWDQWLTDDEIQNATAVLSANHDATGEAAVARATMNYWIAEGDSITDQVSIPTYYYKYFADFPTKFWGRNFALSGSQFSHMNARLPTVLDQIARAIDFGYNPIVSVLLGRNGTLLISELQSYWAAVRAAGAKVVAATVLPATAGGFNTYRNALNTQIRAASADYDALADFALEPTMGPDAAASDLTYYSDGTHPTSAGQDLLKPVMAAALATVDV